MDVFKAYDIRGTYPEEIDEGTAYLVGRAVVAYTKAKRVLVGHDTRISSESLKKALIMGITDQGANVLDIGLCSTPLFYHAGKKFVASVMVTASHNPKQYNGFKLCRQNAHPIGKGTGMEQIKRLVLNQNFPQPKKKGKHKTKNVLQEYIRFSKKFLKTRKPFTVVVDTGNGMGGYTYTAMASIPKTKKIQFIPLYWTLDGTFPNHTPNPVKPGALKKLQETVVKRKADLGIALDGDCDRTIFVDDKGNILPAESIAAFIAQSLQPKKNTFVYTLNASQVFAKTVTEHGGTVVESKVGHAYVIKKMRDLRARFGFETSGHMYHKELGYAENEFLPLFRVLNILGKEKKPLSELIQPYKVCCMQPEISVKLKTNDQAKKILKKLETRYKKSAKKVKKIDGLKMEFADWWFSARASNTEPLLRIVAEADDKKILKTKVAALRKLLK